MSIVWINDAYVSDATAHVPIRDTGLLHAAGVFTTMKAARGTVIRLAQHLARLRQSCEALAIPLPYDDATLTAIASELLSRNSLTDARMRLTVTRGSAAAGGDGLSPTVFFTAAEQAPYPTVLYERGMTVVLIDDQN